MCNLYNITTTQEAVRQWTRAMRDVIGNLEPSVDIYPNQLGPVVRNTPDGNRELAKLLWGLPTPPERMKGKADYGTTNVRNPQYSHWQQYVGIEHRCVVPVTSFAEPSPTPNDKDPETGIQRNYWFARDESRSLFFFAGFWTRWQGVRKVKDGPGDFELYAFMTTKPNPLVAPIHEKAMPVILTTAEETEIWLTAPWTEARHLQRTAPNDALVIVEKPPTQIKFPQQVPVQGSLF
ncbi:SOS response-associated peptidase [Mesorhizobium sp. M8A.F.Ca.ET.165.01.1.1]|uniref:SOS response-associated peptidase n=1 Tax=Mesorhizobium sp. M8A.F.Ca.ET.165.01.1.1 TaxID=2563960 RepID=UPI000FD2B420|nr:SOS response-associated peptidase [Mesorhizobium sp. M8A.F.Ca.ET.165.01.1.1]RUX08321.1 SOS response-associated peptidase [Mesorhizobium sp. M8A.F.Ca.ET.059.01.1.1]TGT41219.1 SOS response-associated peptidase [Mesorhizobium sp. M8A.F.Ca.ET.165.01.1.1]